MRAILLGGMGVALLVFGLTACQPVAVNLTSPYAYEVSDGKIQINLGQSAPFELPVAATGSEVRFDLTYAYTMGTSPFLYSDAEQRNTKVGACLGVKP
jgi:hypothetical protein